MTSSPLTVEGRGGARPPACAFCRRGLGQEYFFTCRWCRASYCYVHMSRHQPSACERPRPAPQAARRVERVASKGGQLLLAGAASSQVSSANV